jgi:hypothetical protein
MRTRDEESEFQTLKTVLAIGFCVGGYVENDRKPEAFEVLIDPLAAGSMIKPIPMGTCSFHGVPNVIQRLVAGYDGELPERIIASNKWNGTRSDLDAILSQFVLACGLPPIRDAVDYVHTCIYSTIKALKFSSLPQICGGPVELAVITTDRKFRWVRHKEWDAAIADGAPK